MGSTEPGESGGMPSPLSLALGEIAHRAGREIMRIYDSGAEVRLKQDRSPVTDADTAAERIILSSLAQLEPATPVIAEEATARGVEPVSAERFFLVDPLDGTKEFLSRNGEFTVNIALIEQGRPTCGAVYAPARERLFCGDRESGSHEAAIAADQPFATARWRRIRARSCASGDVVAVASRSHRDAETEAWLKQREVSRTVSAGSSLKFCLLAAGEADLYPRFGRTMEWDTAAGHAVLAAAGGCVLMRCGAPLCYGKAECGFANPPFFAFGAQQE